MAILPFMKINKYLGDFAHLHNWISQFLIYTEELDDVTKRAYLVDALGDKAEEFVGDLIQSEADFEKLWKRLKGYVENMQNNDYEKWNSNYNDYYRPYYQGWRGYKSYGRANVYNKWNKGFNNNWNNDYEKWNSNYNNYYRPYYQGWRGYKGYGRENVYSKWNRGVNYNRFKTKQTCEICKKDHKIWKCYHYQHG